MRWLNVDLRKRRQPDAAPAVYNEDSLLDFKLLENFEQETIEAQEHIPLAMDDPESPHRWIEIYQNVGGSGDNNIIMSPTFVNAQLGSKDRSQSFIAPYLLLLWTTASENYFFISLGNHRGTVNLSRMLVADDPEHYSHGADTSLRYSLEFASWPLTSGF